MTDKPLSVELLNIYLVDNHRTGTTEIVQAIKSVEENIEDNKEMKIRNQTMYL